MYSELHILCATAERQASRLDSPWQTGEAPPAEAIVHAAAQAPPAARWVMGGGEPTLRSDLPGLVAALAETGPVLGMRTDGLLLSREGIDQQLHDAGLSFVRIPLHCGRADAHDWLVRLPGASARVRKALDQCASGPLTLEAEVTLTRPTAPYLVETISLLVRHGVNAIDLRLLERRGPAAEDYIALAPRLGLLQPLLEDAVRQALRHGVDVRLIGVPLCAAPSFPECHIPADSRTWAIPEGIEVQPTDPSDAGCPGCPGAPGCSGAPAGYGTLFGWAEVQSEGGPQARAQPVQTRPLPASGDPIPPPPGRAGRAPATRLRAAVRQSEHSNLGGDPLAGRHLDPDAAEVVAIEFMPDLPTRHIRMRLVRAAQHGAHTLRIQGASLQHPEAHDLIREAQRLSFDRVEVWGEGSLLDGWSDPQLRHLRGLAELNLVLLGEDASTHDARTGVPGSYAATQRVVERVARLAGIPVHTTEASGPSGHSLLWTDETGGTTRRDSG